MSDPFALEVHRPIATQGTVELPPLPPYVPRAHDERLAEHVRHAVGGASVMAVLVAGSSAGKTRACWQALEPLRQAGGWRLWHPYDPTRPEAALQQLDRVGPRTVVWLNETQDYLGGGENGERVAAKLRTLLADRGRAPVLVLGTLWPTHHNDLTQRPDSQVRQLLGGTIIEVPEAFTSTDLAALQRAAARDSRLAEAIEHAEDGQVTQYLAGGPELLERLATATPEAKAVIWAAMDARRLGHRTVLPLPLLEQAATAYLTDHQYHQLGEDWLEQALAYLSRPCKGARGPITRIRTARARRVPGPRTASFREHGDFPVYRLADYLDQHGRATRTEQMPPPGFWTAVAALAHPTDQAALGDAAWDRGLTRDATQLWKNATDHGHLPAATHLVTRLHRLHPTDSRPAHYSAARVALNDPQGVAVLLGRLQLVGAEAQVAVLLARNPAAHTLLDFPQGVANLLGRLRLVEAHDQVAVLAERAAAHTLNDPHDVGVLLDALREVEAHDQVAVLAECAAAHTPLDNLYGVAILLRRLRFEGAEAQVAVLAERAAAHTPLDNPFGVAFLLDALREVEAEAQVAVLAERAAAHTPLDTPHGVMDLLEALRKVGAQEQVAVLVERLPAAGLFAQFLKVDDHQKRFRFGRDPESNPAARWCWEDLW
ncbi:hypothetical protein [Actinomadura coerulea]|uniref:hypothetical protein n=1 Tax=Actinomadura coerulea TaxID=46159 RepID=UPI00341E781A